MFTGIVTDIGRVRSVRQTERDRRYEIETAWDTAGIAVVYVAAVALMYVVR